MSLNSTVQSNMLSHESVIHINIVFLSESRGTGIVYQTYQGLLLRLGALISISCPSVVFVVHTWSNLYFVSSLFLIVLFYTFYILYSLYLFYIFI